MWIIYSSILISYELGLVEFTIDQINSDFEVVVRWSVVDGLELNVDKCTVHAQHRQT